VEISWEEGKLKEDWNDVTTQRNEVCAPRLLDAGGEAKGDWQKPISPL
jgi:hypothetical protein